MTSTSATQLVPHAAATAPPPAVQVDVWPLRDDGLSAWITQFLALVLAALAWFYGGSLVMAACLWLALQLTLWRMWTPANYLLDHRGITQTVLGRTKRFTWSQVTKAHVRRAGVLVLFEDEGLPLGAFRGLYVRWCNSREDVLAQFDYYVPARVAREKK